MTATGEHVEPLKVEVTVVDTISVVERRFPDLPALEADGARAVVWMAEGAGATSGAGAAAGGGGAEA